jgi:hypothetical protein
LDLQELVAQLQIHEQLVVKLERQVQLVQVLLVQLVQQQLAQVQLVQPLVVVP